MTNNAPYVLAILIPPGNAPFLPHPATGEEGPLDSLLRTRGQHLHWIIVLMRQLSLHFIRDAESGEFLIDCFLELMKGPDRVSLLAELFDRLAVPGSMNHAQVVAFQDQRQACEQGQGALPDGVIGELLHDDLSGAI